MGKNHIIVPPVKKKEKIWAYNTGFCQISLDQPLATRSNPYQNVSTHINPYQPVSTYINPYQPLSTRINPCQPVSTRINPNQPISTHINLYQSVSTWINLNQAVSTHINLNQPVSTRFNLYQPVSTCLKFASYACSCLFFHWPRRSQTVAKSHFFPFSSGYLDWIGCDKSCSTLIGWHKLDAVHMHVCTCPATDKCCVHLWLWS